MKNSEKICEESREKCSPKLFFFITNINYTYICFSIAVPNIDTSIYRSPDVSLHRNVDMPLHRNSDESIIFPDGRISSRTSVQPASACRKSTFCENVADYPRQLVNAAIARNASLRFLESIDPVRDNFIVIKVYARERSLS